MIAMALLTAILWFGLATLRAAEATRWWLTGFELAMIVLGAAVIIRKRLAIRFHPVGVILAVASLWALAQVWFGISVDPQRTLESALGWTMNCAAFSITLAVCASEQIRHRFLTAQVLFALALSASCMVTLYSVHTLGPFAYKNQLAAYLESVTGIAIVAAMRDQKRSLAWICVAAAMFACVVAAGSRAGSILCLAELLILPVVASLRGLISARALVRIGALAIASGAVLVMVTGWETVWQRFQEPNPYSLRADLLRSSIAMTRDRPLEGFGLGAWPSAYPAYARYDDGTFVNQAHNDWAQWASEGGVIFLLLMLAVLGMLLRPALASLWGLGLIAVFIHAWVDYPFEQRPALAAFFFAMAGALASEPSVKKHAPGE